MHATGTRDDEADNTLSMPSGESVPIEMGDAVFPCVTKFGASVGLCIEDDRIKMYEENDCTVSLGVAKRSIEPGNPVATLYSSINHDPDGDDLYSETAFEDTDALRELRDALTTALRYRGADVGFVEMFGKHKDALSDEDLRELRLRIQDEENRRKARERQAERENRGETDE